MRACNFCEQWIHWLPELNLSYAKIERDELLNPKMHIIQGVYLCEKCYSLYKKVEDSVSDAENFEGNLAEFQATCSEKQGLDVLVKYLIRLYNADVSERKELFRQTRVEELAGLLKDVEKEMRCFEEELNTMSCPCCASIHNATDYSLRQLGTRREFLMCEFLALKADEE